MRTARAALLAAVMLAPACARPPRPGTPPRHVLLITVSGLRADHLSAFGYPRPTTAAEPLPGGAAAARRVRDAALVLLAADAQGGASRCVDLAVQYAKTREQFGVTIGHFQALKHQLANMGLEVEPSRALWWYAAHAFDSLPDEAPRAAALAKAHLTDVYMQVARDTVEAHGGIGFTWECDVQIWFKRAIYDRTFGGSPAVHRERAAKLAGW
jgi:alkylation response protein AidB-like acyl-CoA dehydrogenase